MSVYFHRDRPQKYMIPKPLAPVALVDHAEKAILPLMRKQSSAMSQDPFEQTIQALLALGGQRVWSLMVTLFGDLAQAEGQGIDGPVLSIVMSEMAIRPEAVRVALHRLRNDGWIASEKRGRTRRHTLTAKSRAESAAASARIYAPPDEPDGDWQLVILEDSGGASHDGMAKRGFAPLLPRVYLGAAQCHPPQDALVLPGDHAPDWLRQQIAPKVLQDEYRALQDVLMTAEKRLGSAAGLSAQQQAVLRCLIVHNWRRIVLRHPALPRKLLPRDWAGHSCHILVNRLLTRFPRPALGDIVAT